jgi:hypothetical protein
MNCLIDLYRSVSSLGGHERRTLGSITSAALRRGRPGDLSVLTQLLPGVLLLAILTSTSVLRRLLGAPNELNTGICASTSVEHFG